MPARGEIKVYDKYSTKAFTVATNIKQPLVYVVPSQIIDVEKTSSTLADILKIDKAVLKDKLLLAGRSYVPLKKNLTEEESKAITSLNLGGVQLDYEVSRYYPEQDLLSHVLGFVGFRKDSGSTKVGVYGLEKSFEENLAGQAGSLKSVKDAKGLWLLGIENIYTEKGVKYVHHLETAVRAAALFRKDKDYVVKDGEVVIVEVKT
jgi:cell division protein FtsI/penicillin-binding protein 2